MAPHITAELWARRHDGEHIHEQPWPVADPALAAVDTVTMVVQVNGKVRDRLEVPAGIDAAEAEQRRARRRCRHKLDGRARAGDRPRAQAGELRYQGVTNSASGAVGRVVPPAPRLTLASRIEARGRRSTARSRS